MSEFVRLWSDLKIKQLEVEGARSPVFHSWRRQWHQCLRLFLNESIYVSETTHQTNSLFPIYPVPFSPRFSSHNRGGVVWIYIAAVCSGSRHHQKHGPLRPGLARRRALRFDGASSHGRPAIVVDRRWDRSGPVVWNMRGRGLRDSERLKTSIHCWSPIPCDRIM